MVSGISRKSQDLSNFSQNFTHKKKKLNPNENACEKDKKIILSVKYKYYIIKIIIYGSSREK